MPGHELLVQQVALTLGLPQRLTVKGQEQLVEAPGTVGQLGNLHLPPEGQAVRPVAEQLVVQRTQRQSVHLAVGAARLVPLDVCGFEAEFTAAKSQIVAATAQRYS